MPETINIKLGRFSRSLNVWMVYAIILVLLIATPIFTIIINIFQGPGETMQHLARTVLSDYLYNSIFLMLGVGILSLILGISSGWIVSTCHFPGRRFLEWALILPLAVPTYIMAYIYAGIFDYFGTYQLLVNHTFGFIPARINIMNIWGVVFVMSFALYPYIYVISRAAFTNQSQTILESSRILGAGAYRTFFKIALPIIRPAVVGGLLLVIMEVLNDYGAVKYFGVSTFTIGIFRAWFSLGDFNAAIYLSAILMLFILSLIWIERKQRGKARFDEGGVIKRPLQRYKLNFIQKISCVIVCAIPLLFGFVIPLIQLLYWAYHTAGKIFNTQFYELILNTFTVAIITSVLCVLIAIILIYSVKLNQKYFIRILAKISVLGYSIPGAVIAVGIMIPFIFVDKSIISGLEKTTGINYGLLLSGTSFALIFAYVVRFLAVGYNPIDSGFKKVCTNLDEASRSLGVNPVKTLLKIDIPLIKPAIFSGALLVFVDVLKELPLTLILRPFNFNTLATKAFEYAGNEMLAEAANPALIIIATGILPIFFLSNFISKKEDREGPGN